MLKIEDKEFIDDQLRTLSPESIKLWEDYLPENYTINFMLNKSEWRKLYEKLIYQFEKVGGNDLYIYPFDRLHMTLLGRIDRNLDETRLIETVKNNMLGKIFRFKVGYLANNNQSISIISEPEFDLQELRNNIRKELGVAGGDYTKYANIYERLSWINIIRFKERPGYKFFETLWNLRNFQFGEYEAKDISVFLNSSRTLDTARCKLIEKVVF